MKKITIQVHFTKTIGPGEWWSMLDIMDYIITLRRACEHIPTYDNFFIFHN